MNRFKCQQCGGNQYTAVDKVERCIYCGNPEFEKMDTLEPEQEAIEYFEVLLERLGNGDN